MRNRICLVYIASVFTGCTVSPPAAEHDARALATAVVDPPRAGNIAGTPAFLQSRFGLRGNFELATPAATTGLSYYWRDNDHGGFWNGPDAVFTDGGHFDGLSMIESTDSFPGDMDLVATIAGRLVFLYRDSDPVTPWHGPSTIVAEGIAATPSLTESGAGAAHTLDVVVPGASGGLVHVWRGSDGVWHGPETLWADAGWFDAVSTVAASTTGLLDGVARRGSDLVFFYRDVSWHSPVLFGAGAAGNPVLVERRVAAPGRLDVVVPSTAGGVDYYWRDGDAGWSGPARLFADIGPVDAVGAFESSDGTLQLALRQAAALSLASGVDALPWQGTSPLSLPTDPSYFAEPPPQLHKGYTQYLGSFSGNPVNREAAFGLTGTDLGVGFVTARGDLAFLFGDARTPSLVYDNLDSIAKVDLTGWDPKRAKNAFAGHTVYSIVLEVPDDQLLPNGIENQRIGVWALSTLATDDGGWRIINRCGLPMIHPLFTPYNEDLGNRLNPGHPSDDLNTFGETIAEAIAGVVAANGTADDPRAYGEQVARRFCPNMLPYTVGTPAAFGFVEWNGRSLTDNAPDVMFSIAANTPIRLGIGKESVGSSLPSNSGHAVAATCAGAVNCAHQVRNHGIGPSISLSTGRAT